MLAHPHLLFELCVHSGGLNQILCLKLIVDNPVRQWSIFLVVIGRKELYLAPTSAKEWIALGQLEWCELLHSIVNEVRTPNLASWLTFF